MVSYRGNKGQAAFEFLNTYGWALMILITIMGVLYFGYFQNPERLVKDSCEFSSAFSCRDYVVFADGQMSLDLLNIGDRSINVTELVCTYNNVNYASIPRNPIVIRPGEIGTVPCIMSPTPFTADRKVKITVKVSYLSEGKLFLSEADGTVITKVI